MANVTFRTDDQAETDLRILLEEWGGSRTDAIRRALHCTAEEALAKRVLTRSRELAEDPEDRQAVAEALADMEDLRAW